MPTDQPPHTWLSLLTGWPLSLLGLREAGHILQDSVSSEWQELSICRDTVPRRGWEGGGAQQKIQGRRTESKPEDSSLLELETGSLITELESGN